MHATYSIQKDLAGAIPPEYYKYIAAGFITHLSLEAATSNTA